MARLPGVYPERLDGGLALTPDNADGLRVIVGVSSVAVPNVLLTFSDIRDVPSRAGSGPGARGVADHLKFGGGLVYFVPAAPDIAGVITPDAGNPVAPAVTLTGAPLDRYDVIVKITTAGALGVGAFTYSLDGGDTVSRPISLSASYVIPGTGVTLNFAVGAYVLAVAYLFACTAPKASVSSVQAAVNVAINANIIFEFIQIVQPSDIAFWTAMDALALSAESLFKWFDILCETVAPGADPDAWVNARIAEIAPYSSVRTPIVAWWAEVVDSLTGRLELQSMASRIAARASKNPVQRKTARVKDGPMSGFVVTAPFTISDDIRKESKVNNGHALTLEQAGFITGYSLNGVAGYVVEDRVPALPTSDFKLWTYRSVMNKATRAVYAASLIDVQDEVDPTELEASTKSLLAKLNAPLRQMVKDRECTRARLQIAPGQDVLSTSKLRIQIRIVPVAYLREIVSELSYETVIPNPLA